MYTDGLLFVYIWICSCLIYKLHKNGRSKHYDDSTVYAFYVKEPIKNQHTLFSPSVILHDIDTKLYKVARVNFTWRTFLSTLAQALVIDKCTIAALGVL